MKTLVSIALFALLCALPALGQTNGFPAIPLPVAVAGFASYNQLGEPRITGGVSAIYPIVGSIGMYGSTTAEILPKKAIDPTTKRQFYAVASSIRQGLHKDVFDTGRFSFLVGGDVGPGFSQAQPTGINVSLSASFIATPIYQISPAVSFILPVRMLYITGIGWNPVVEAGVAVNLKNLPGKKP